VQYEISSFPILGIWSSKTSNTFSSRAGFPIQLGQLHFNVLRGMSTILFALIPLRRYTGRPPDTEFQSNSVQFFQFHKSSAVLLSVEEGLPPSLKPSTLLNSTCSRNTTHNSIYPNSNTQFGPEDPSQVGYPGNRNSSQDDESSNLIRYLQINRRILSSDLVRLHFIESGELKPLHCPTCDRECQQS
jgi:hypothetical protein